MYTSTQEGFSLLSGCWCLFRGSFFATGSRWRIGWYSSRRSWAVNIIDGLSVACWGHSRVGQVHATAAAELRWWWLCGQRIVAVCFIVAAWVARARIFTGAVVHLASWMQTAAQAWAASASTTWSRVLEITNVAVELRSRCCFCRRFEMC